MLLVIDVGNTNITYGIYDGDKLINTFRIMSKTPRTTDEFGTTVTDLIEKKGVNIKDIDGAIIASVVPDIMHALINSVREYLGIVTAYMLHHLERLPCKTVYQTVFHLLSQFIAEMIYHIRWVSNVLGYIELAFASLVEVLTGLLQKLRMLLPHVTHLSEHSE